MVCKKCSGLTVFSKITDYKSSENPTITVEKCLNCGGLNDPVFELNRKFSQDIISRVAQNNGDLEKTINQGVLEF